MVAALDAQAVLRYRQDAFRFAPQLPVHDPKVWSGVLREPA